MIPYCVFQASGIGLGGYHDGFPPVLASPGTDIYRRHGFIAFVAILKWSDYFSDFILEVPELFFPCCGGYERSSVNLTMTYSIPLALLTVPINEYCTPEVFRKIGRYIHLHWCYFDSTVILSHRLS
jgi:hypothetical protein